MCWISSTTDRPNHISGIHHNHYAVIHHAAAAAPYDQKPHIEHTFHQPTYSSWVPGVLQKPTVQSFSLTKSTITHPTTKRTLDTAIDKTHKLCVLSMDMDTAYRTASALLIPITPAGVPGQLAPTFVLGLVGKCLSLIAS
mgnify:FL=1